MNILCVWPVTEAQRSFLDLKAGEEKIKYIPKADVGPEDLEKVEVLLGNVAPTMLEDAKKLKWLQLNSAGADAYCKEGVLPTGTLLTNATGAYGLALSEHMLALLLAMKKKLYRYYDNQKASLWRDEGTVTSIFGSRVLIVGMGDIGSEFGKKVKALGAYVVGIKRRASAKPDYIDAMATMDNLDQELALADIVVSVLPGTKATYKIFNKERFAAMKRGACFLNIGRGNAVDTDSLVEAALSGHLGGVAVDVTDPEPLPADHPLWSTPNVYITPHISGDYHLPATLDNIVTIAGNNLAAYLKGDELHNLVDFTTGYKK